MPSNPASWVRQLFPTSHRLLLEKRLRPLLGRVDGRVLVVGAGHNPYRNWLSPRAEPVVTDISDEHGTIDLIADVQALPFRNDEFEHVLAIEVFEHIPAPQKAASELHRVLRPGGRALVTYPFFFHVHGDPHDYQRFTRDGGANLFKNAGFAAVELTGYGSRIHAVSDIVTTAARPLAALRIVNHLLALSAQASVDCPSGFIASATK